MTVLMAEIAFWASFGILLYVYLGYLIVLLVMSKLRQESVLKAEIFPTVSIIICAYNEEKHIERKIANCLELDYPHDKIEVIAVSDGSRDGTNAILDKLRVGNPRLKTLYMPERSGKTACQNAAVNMAEHEVLFLTDATTMHPKNALRLLVRSLRDPSVGCVTGKPVFKPDSGLISTGQEKRDRYEYFLRSKLGEIKTLFGAQDCIYAIPRHLYPPIRPDLDSGFVGPLKILERGYRTVYEPEGIAIVDRRPPDMKDEFARRSRIMLRGMRGLLHMRHLMNPFKYGFVAVSLISTRLLRWLTPVWLVILLASNVFLLHSTFYLGAFLLQVGFYLAACVAFLVEQRGYRLGAVFSVPLYICTLAAAAADGLRRLLAGETGQLWQTRR
jgi:cellulose synthase/poly-beta-1,6-N-acetylglucosamine synthase-like glycosyltransferase